MAAAEAFRVLLVYPNYSMMKIPALAMGLFAAILKARGYEVAFFDSSLYAGEFESSHDDRRTGSFQYRRTAKIPGPEPLRDLHGDFRRRVLEFRPRAILVSTVEDTFQQGVRMLAGIRDLEIPTLVGGVFPTMAPEEALSFEPVRMVGIGEGEELIVDFCERVRQGQDPADTPGVWTRLPDGGLRRNPLRPLTDISRAAPDYGFFREHQFLRPWGGTIFRTITVEGMRGCPYECTFCNSPAHNRLARQVGSKTFVREKSIEALDAELAALMESTAPGFIMFVDDSFLTRPFRHVEQWCRMYEKYRVPFWVNTRVESISPEKLAMLKAVGCHRLSFSIEHGNEAFRKKHLRKFFSNEQAVAGGRIVAESGIPFSMDVLIGLPFETRELLFDSVEIIRRIPGYDALTISIFTPYRGTRLREVALEQGWLDPAAFPNGISGASMLRMPRPYLQREDIEGLFRTFAMYCLFPKDRWAEIRRAESFDAEGDAAFARLGAEYYEQKFGNRESTLPPQEYLRGSGCRAADNDSV